MRRSKSFISNAIYCSLASMALFFYPCGTRRWQVSTESCVSSFPGPSCPVPWQAVPPSAPLPAPVLGYNHTIILKWSQTPPGLYQILNLSSPQTGTLPTASWCGSPPSQSPSDGLISLPTQLKKRILEEMSFLKKKQPSLEVYQDSPQKQDWNSLTLNYEQPGLFIIFNTNHVLTYHCYQLCTRLEYQVSLCTASA